MLDISSSSNAQQRITRQQLTRNINNNININNDNKHNFPSSSPLHNHQHRLAINHHPFTTSAPLSSSSTTTTPSSLSPSIHPSTTAQLSLHTPANNTAAAAMYSSKPKSTTTGAAPNHLGNSNGYAPSNATGRVPTSTNPNADQDGSGTTTTDDTHLVSQQQHTLLNSSIGTTTNSNNANGNNNPSTSTPNGAGVSNMNNKLNSGNSTSYDNNIAGLIPKLSYSNYTFWLMSLQLASALYRCEDHIISDPPVPNDPDGKDTHRRAAAQAWLLLTQSVPEEIRHQLTIDDLSSPPSKIISKLKQVILSHPENSRSYLLNRAQTMIFHQGESMSKYLNTHDGIRQRMILVDHIKEDDEATTILFILCGLRHNPDYTDVCSAARVKMASSSLTLAELKHDLLKEEQYLKSKQQQQQHQQQQRQQVHQHSNSSFASNVNGRVHHMNGGTNHQSTSGAVGNGSGVNNAGVNGNSNNGNGGSSDELSVGTNHSSPRSVLNGGRIASSTATSRGRERQQQYENGSTRNVRSGTGNASANVNGSSNSNGTGMWCSFHQVATHSTEDCQAKARHEALGNKWCTYHEVNTHDTSECKAKARHETLGTKWCSFHESHSHNTDECEAKRRNDEYQNKWCAYHESHTHNTDECQAKARQDALYSR